MADTKQTADVKKIPETAPPIQLQKGALSLLEISCNAWRAIIPARISVDAIEANPSFWNLSAPDLNPADTIRAIAADGSYIAEFCVLARSESQALVSLVWERKVNARLLTADSELPDGWVLRESAPGEPYGWFGFQPSTGKKILDSSLPFKTREAARRGVLDHPIFRKADSVRYVA